MERSRRMPCAGAAAAAREQATHRRTHRDADEEALQAALLESVQPDYLAEILQAETETERSSDDRSDRSTARAAVAASAVATRPPRSTLVPSAVTANSSHFIETVANSDVDDNDDDLISRIDDSLTLTDVADADDTTDDQDDVVLVDLLTYLDEDSVGYCLHTCKRLYHVARHEDVLAMLCRRIFTIQNPNAARAATSNQFTLRHWPSWRAMLHDRPRVRYNGFYWLKIAYYKKPELNMWTTEITPGTILQVVYYRYLSFQRDGSVIYSMLFKPPHEAAHVLRQCGSSGKDDVYVGTYRVERDRVFVSVPTKHIAIEFVFRIRGRNGSNLSSTTRGKHTTLVLDEHYSFSEPDRTGWIDAYQTAEEEFQYYRSWNL